MARLVPAGLIVAIFYGAPAAADPPDNPWLANERAAPARNFDTGGQQGRPRAGQHYGSRMIAGREIMPNGMLGIGFFGERSLGHRPAPVTGTELAIPKQRRAAVGFSLKF